jgi:SAM-dependent methyltransferase
LVTGHIIKKSQVQKTIMNKKDIQLEIYPSDEYTPIDSHDPLKFYFVPGFKNLYRERLKRCLAECTGGEKILEVGFGSGLIFPNLVKMYRQIYGIEKNDPYIISKIEKNFQKRNIHTYLTSGDLLNMPYQDNEFDTVLIISVLEHLQPQEQTRAFSELYRIIRPGGQLVYGVPIDRPLMTFLYRLLGYRIKNFHFSDQEVIRRNAQNKFWHVGYENLNAFGLNFFSVYQVAHCQKKNTNRRKKDMKLSVNAIR